MTADSTTDGDSSTDPADTAAAGNAHPDPNQSEPSTPGYATDIDSLQAIVVRYQNASDRCTVTPTEVADEKRLTAWISVDTAVVRSLEETR